MMELLVRLVLAAVVFASSSSFAHIKLTAPASFQRTNFLGDPQKLEPCGGPGTATNAVTEVQAGAQLTVSWNETIYHPGHFRIAIARSASDFVTPPPVVTGNDCKSAPISTSSSLPLMADGLLPNRTGSGTWTSTVTVPMMSCENCVLQLMQFMSAHAPPCFYYQCANIKIVMPDAGVSPNNTSDAGTSDAGVTATVTDSGVDSGSSDAPDAGPAVDGQPPVGCGCTTSPLSLLVFGVPGLLRFRRRKLS
jgi:hypothetical protein